MKITRRLQPFAFILLALAFVAAALPAGVAAAEGGEEGASKVLEVTLQRPEGGVERLSDHRGRRLLLDLWATWCLPCRQQSEVVRDLAADLASHEVKVLAINVGEGPRIVLDFLSRTPLPHPVLLDRGQQIPRDLGIRGLPALVLVREDGTVAGVRTGLVTREDLEAWLDEAFGDEVKAR